MHYILMVKYSITRSDIENCYVISYQRYRNYRYIITFHQLPGFLVNIRMYISYQNLKINVNDFNMILQVSLN